MPDSEQRFRLKVKSGHPNFLDLPWQQSINDWQIENFLDLPKAMSRHSVRFVDYPEGIYVIKELPLRAAMRDYETLSSLENQEVLSAVPVGLVTGRYPDAGAEQSAALITEYIHYSLSYLELLQGPGFGFRRNKMLDAFAGLLVQLHLINCFWGDCSLGNVLYRYDADGIEVIMIDAETSRIYPRISDGQRQEDLEIMKLNLAGGMADIAASQSATLSEADLEMGIDVESRYLQLWAEIMDAITISRHEHYRIHEKTQRLNKLGFNVESLCIVEKDETERLDLRFKVGSRNFHTARLKGLTGVDTLERQARYILNDVRFYELQQNAETASEKMLAAVHWRMHEFEPMLERLRKLENVKDPVQAYCDLLHARYEISRKRNYSVPMEEAYHVWIANGRPGYPQETYVEDI